MKKLLIGLVAMLLVLSSVSMALAANGLSGKKIFVDPGHGGTDPGAVGPTGLQEKSVNLRVGTVLKECLIEYGGATVQMSRTDDSYVGLSDRAAAANNWGADRFISIHHNAFSDASVNGTETYSYYSYGDCADLSKKVQAQLVNWGNLNNRGAKTANYTVLRETTMPAILTEASFISNPDEEARLRDPSYTWREGYYIYKGVCDHYSVGY
jgi:N-acetylmuramoyl-L-alanine amidase